MKRLADAMEGVAAELRSGDPDDWEGEKDMLWANLRNVMYDYEENNGVYTAINYNGDSVVQDIEHDHGKSLSLEFPSYRDFDFDILWERFNPQCW